jgi:outer membrane cobalamin receptor
MMRGEAVKLTPLTLDAPRDRYLESNGFYERMKTGSGHFMTGDQIRKRNAFALADLLRGMRGIKIQRVNSRSEVYFTGANCLPMIILDGVTVRWGGKSVGTIQPLEDLVPISHIDGIEVYRGGSGLPPEFIGPNAGCGVILIWTRHR